MANESHQRKLGDTAPSISSHPSPFGWYPWVSHGGRSRTRDLRHSVDVLVQYGVHPYQHPVTMLTSFTPT